MLRVVPMPADANYHGDIFGGWIMSQVDIAGGVVAARHARGRVATVAVNSFVFKQPVLIGDLVTFFAEVTRIGRTSITVDVEVFAQRNPSDEITRQGDRGEPHVCCGRPDRRPRELPPDDTRRRIPRAIRRQRVPRVTLARSCADVGPQRRVWLCNCVARRPEAQCRRIVEKQISRKRRNRRRTARHGHDGSTEGENCT